MNERNRVSEELSRLKRNVLLSTFGAALIVFTIVAWVFMYLDKQHTISFVIHTLNTLTERFTPTDLKKILILNFKTNKEKAIYWFNIADKVVKNSNYKETIGKKCIIMKYPSKKNVYLISIPNLKMEILAVSHPKEKNFFVGINPKLITSANMKENFKYLFALLFIFLIGSSIVAVMSLNRIFSDMTQFINEVFALVEDKNDLRWNTQLEKGVVGKVAQTLKEFVVHINWLFSETRKIILEIQNSMNKIADLTSTMKNRANKSLANAENIASAVEELNMGLKEVNQNLNQIKLLTDKFAEVVDTSFRNLTSLVEWSNNQGLPKLENLHSSANELNVAVSKIKQAVIIISNIASKTNLLALNAAIEAARAGEAGKGFAVVADEIRKLSDNTAKQVKEINQIISNIVTVSNEVGEGIYSYVQENKNELENLNTTLSMFSEVRNQFNSIQLSISQVASAVNQGVEAASSILENILELTEQVKLNSNATKEIASHVDSTKREVENLADKVAKLKMMDI